MASGGVTIDIDNSRCSQLIGRLEACGDERTVLAVAAVFEVLHGLGLALETETVEVMGVMTVVTHPSPALRGCVDRLIGLADPG